MDGEKGLPKRKRNRLENYDYSSHGAYFITVCTQHRKRILSRIVGVDVLGDPQNVELLPHGKIADKYINQFNEFYDNVTVEQYVIMPNHIHILLHVFDDGTPRTSSPTKQTSLVSHFISTFKRFCNKESNENVWQRGFYDPGIRSRKDYEEHLKYIYENPARWQDDELYSEE